MSIELRDMLVAAALLPWASAALAQPAWRTPPTAFVELTYPKEALDARVQGTVILSVTTDATGKVTEARPLAGPAVLATAAAANATQWTLAGGAREDALVYRFEIAYALCRDDTRSLFRLWPYNVALITACSTRERRGSAEPVEDYELLPRSFGKAAVFPQIARSARIAGAVILHLAVDARGDVLEARALNELPMLQQTAVDHARTWKFYESARARRDVVVVYEFAFDSQMCRPQEQEPFWRVAAQYFRLSVCTPLVQPQR